MSEDLVEVPKITIGAGLIVFGVGVVGDDKNESIGIFKLDEGLKAGEKIPKGHGKKLILIFEFLNLEGLEQLEISLDKIRKNLILEAQK